MIHGLFNSIWNYSLITMKAGDSILFMSELSVLHTVLSQSIHSINVVGWINQGDAGLGRNREAAGTVSDTGWCMCVLCALMSDSLWPHGLYSPPGSSVYGIFQARILEWVSISFSRGSSQARDWTHISCLGRRILYHPGSPMMHVGLTNFLFAHSQLT